MGSQKAGKVQSELLFRETQPCCLFQESGEPKFDKTSFRDMAYVYKDEKTSGYSKLKA